MLDKSKVITLDGPGGSGKGTAGAILSQKLGWHYLDSGAIYRALAWYAKENNIFPTDEVALSESTNNYKLEFLDKKVYIDSSDVTRDIRSEACGNFASKIAALPMVKDSLLAAQRRYRQPPGLVADGRDMGTRVFPDADLKIYLDASVEVRAKRRFEQLQHSNPGVKLGDVIEEVSSRDARDMNRAHAPLRPADDAIIIDSSQMSVDEVVDEILRCASSLTTSRFS